MSTRDYATMAIILGIEATLFMLFIDKKDKRKLANTYLFSVSMATVIDSLSVALGLWTYPSNLLPGVGINLPADFLYYPVFTFFYIQFLPRHRWLPYTAAFALISTLVEITVYRLTTLLKYGPLMSPGLAYVQYFMAYLALRRYILWFYGNKTIPNFPRR